MIIIGQMSGGSKSDQIYSPRNRVLPSSAFWMGKVILLYVAAYFSSYIKQTGRRIASDNGEG